MKSLTIGLILLHLLSYGYAQEFKGKTVMSLGLGYRFHDGKSTSSGDIGENRDIHLSLNAGHFVSKKLVLGTGYTLTRRKEFIEYPSFGRTITATTTQQKVFVYGQLFQQISGSRFYYWPLLAPFYSLDRGKSIQKDEGFSDAVYSVRKTAFGIEVRPLEFSFLLSKRVLLGTGFSTITFTRGQDKISNGNEIEQRRYTRLDAVASLVLSHFTVSLLF